MSLPNNLDNYVSKRNKEHYSKLSYVHKTWRFYRKSQ